MVNRGVLVRGVAALAVAGSVLAASPGIAGADEVTVEAGVDGGEVAPRLQVRAGQLAALELGLAHRFAVGRVDGQVTLRHGLTGCVAHDHVG